MQILPPEIEEGNSEYKRLFKNLEDKRINELTTQMKWRLDEGNDICHYFIGIDDDGSLYQELSTKDIKYSFKILKILSEKCNSKIYKVKPGLTGIGSIIFRDEESIISAVTDEDPHEFYKRIIATYKGELEMWYQSNCSFLLDLQLIFMTAWVILVPTSKLYEKWFKDLPKRSF